MHLIRGTYMTYRDEVLKAARFLAYNSLDGTFSPVDVINRMGLMGTNFRESTIRTHVVSRMCYQAPTNHAAKYDDLERIGRGRYRPR